MANKWFSIQFKREIEFWNIARNLNEKNNFLNHYNLKPDQVKIDQIIMRDSLVITICYYAEKELVWPLS